MAQRPTHQQRERAFESIFGTVRADSGGTGMGSSDKERDETLRRISFDQLPDSITSYELPLSHKTKSADLTDVSTSKASQPLELDEKTKNFCALFGQVTPGQSEAYGGQSVQPDADVQFAQLPEKPDEPLPDVTPTVPERDFLKEEMEERERNARGKPVRSPSKRYSEAHEKYVQIFGDVEDKS